MVMRNTPHPIKLLCSAPPIKATCFAFHFYLSSLIHDPTNMMNSNATSLLGMF